jgi:hypothetical protein
MDLLRVFRILMPPRDVGNHGAWAYGAWVYLGLGIGHGASGLECPNGVLCLVLGSLAS